MIEYGYKWFNGLVLCNTHTERYNAMTGVINASCGDYKDWMIEARHKFLIACFDVVRTSV